MVIRGRGLVRTGILAVVGLALAAEPALGDVICKKKRGAMCILTGVTHPETGVYCVTPAAGIDPTLTPCVVSPEWADSAGYDLFAEWDSGGGPCPAGDYAVRTYQLPRAADGSIVVGTPTASDTVAFVLIVP